MYDNNIQRLIEKNVTNGRGYDRRNTPMPHYLRNTEIGLQIELANMDTVDGKLGMMEVLDFGSRLQRLLDDYREAKIPFETIKDADVFDDEIRKVYGKRISSSEIIEKYLLPRKINDDTIWEPYRHPFQKMIINLTEDKHFFTLPYRGYKNFLDFQS